MNDTLDRTLRGLDPAVTPADLDAHTDPRARALLARLVATDPAAAPALAPTIPSPRRRTARRLIAVGGAVAAGGVAALLLPDLLGGGVAMASWSATPHPVTGTRATTAQDRCLDDARDTVADNHRAGPGAKVGRLRPVVTEGRGAWTLVYINDGPTKPRHDGTEVMSEFSCLLYDGRWFGSSGSVAAADAPALPAVAPNSASALLGDLAGTQDETVRMVTGRVGADVVGLVLDTNAKGPVTATVTGGYFAAWWPDAPTTEEYENAHPRGGVKGVVAILRDGSRRTISLEELTGMTTQELNTPAKGGGAS